MSTFKTISIIAATSIFLAAPIAFAGEASDNTVKTEKETRVVSQANEDVRGVVSVTDKNGTVYVNHYVLESELPDPRLDIDVIDTYSYEYEGRTYTNRVVETD